MTTAPPLAAIVFGGSGLTGPGPAAFTATAVDLTSIASAPTGHGADLDPLDGANIHIHLQPRGRRVVTIIKGLDTVPGLSIKVGSPAVIQFIYRVFSIL